VPGFSEGDCLAGRYRLIRFIAAGGMGEVFAAEDLLLGVHVAIKSIRPDIADDRRALARFRREVLLARRVTHPNVCRIFELAHAAVGPVEVPFLVMELLVGETLADRIARAGRMTPSEALPIAAALANALDAAHAAGVLHRDFKSPNVVLADRPVVTDFGLARAQDTLEGDGGASGTPDYMAPEQLHGRPTSPRADVYAFGAVLFEMVTGTLPFAGTDRRADLPAPPASTRTPGLDPRWDAAIARCLAVDPEARFARAGDVLVALGAAPPRRRTWRLVAALAVTASLAAAFVLTRPEVAERSSAALERGLADFYAVVDANRLDDARALLDRLREHPDIDPGDLLLDIADAHLAGAIGDYRSAQAAAARAAVKARARGDKLRLISARDSEQWSLYNLGEPGRVREAIEEVRRLRLELGDQDGAVHTLDVLATLATERGELAEARRLHDEVIAHFRPRGVAHITMTLSFIADLELRRGRLAAADEAIDELSAVGPRTDYPPAVAYHDMFLGRRLEQRGDLSGARARFIAAERIYREYNDNRSLAATLVAIGRVLVAEGDLVAARGPLAEANTIRRTLGVRRTIAESQTALAELALAEHDPTAAEALAREAVAEMSRQGALDGQALATAVLARALTMRGRTDEAARLLAPHLARRSESAEVRTRLAIAAGDPAGLDAAIAETHAAGLVALEREARSARAAPSDGPA